MKKLEKIYYKPSHAASFFRVQKLLHKTKKTIPKNKTIDWRVKTHIHYISLYIIDILLVSIVVPLSATK